MEKQLSEQGTVRYIRCPSCGTPNPAAAGACSRCAKPLAGSPRAAPAPAAQPITCAKCRNQLPPGSKFCGFCGAPLAVPPPSAPAQPGKPSTPPPPAAPRAMPAPVVKASPPPAPAPVTPPKAKSPAARGPEGTVAFTGLGAPKIQASFSELKQDGSTGRTIAVSKEIFVGQRNCDASYPGDPLLSARHASVAVRQGKLFLRDWDSQNGTFIKLREDTELRPGEVFLLGRELFRFTTQSLD